MRYRQKIRDLGDEQLVDKVYKAYFWLNDNYEKSKDGEFIAAELAYRTIVDELRERGRDEPDYHFSNKEMVEEVFKDIIEGQ